MRLLIVEDERRLAVSLARGLTAEGFAVDVEHDGLDGLHRASEGAYDLIRSGRARIHIDSVFPLAEAAQAHERVEAGAQFGKVVLAIPG